MHIRRPNEHGRPASPPTLELFYLSWLWIPHSMNIIGFIATAVLIDPNYGVELFVGSLFTYDSMHLYWWNINTRSCSALVNYSPSPKINMYNAGNLMVIEWEMLQQKESQMRPHRRWTRRGESTHIKSSEKMVLQFATKNALLKQNTIICAVPSNIVIRKGECVNIFSCTRNGTLIHLFYLVLFYGGQLCLLSVAIAD